jgi:hypothetical protein
MFDSRLAVGFMVAAVQGVGDGINLLAHLTPLLGSPSRGLT